MAKQLDEKVACRIMDSIVYSHQYAAKELQTADQKQRYRVLEKYACKTPVSCYENATVTVIE